MTEPPPTVAVLGAGMAGLLAAHRLRQAGCRVRLLEAASQAGGIARTIRRDGWTIDLGAVTMGEPGATVAEVLRQAGEAEVLVEPAAGMSRRYLVHEGRPVAVPTTTAEMLATPLLSVAGRLRMLKEPFVARGGGGEETAAAFARRRFGDETAERFMDPLVASTTGGDPNLVLAAYAFPKLVDFERRAGSVLKGRMRATREARRLGRRPAREGVAALTGLGALAERLAVGLSGDLRTGAAVEAVRRAGDLIEVRLADGTTEHHDAAIVALPAWAIGRVDWQVPGPGLAPVAAVPHASLATVSLGYRRDAVAHPLDGHGLLAPTGERRRVLSVLFVSSLFPDRAPAGHVLLTAVAGGVHRMADLALDDAALVELVREECEALLGARGAPALAEVARWPDAMPLAVAGHPARLAAAAATEAATPRLAFCGAWHDGLSVGDVMLGGVRAADRVLGALGRPPVESPDPAAA